jgi:hypothetical protein
MVCDYRLGAGAKIFSNRKSQIKNLKFLQGVSLRIVRNCFIAGESTLFFL